MLDGFEKDAVQCGHWQFSLGVQQTNPARFLYEQCGYGREATQAMLAELTSRYAVRDFTAVLKRANFRSLGLLQRLGFVPAPADLLAQTGIESDEVMLHSVGHTNQQRRKPK